MSPVLGGGSSATANDLGNWATATGYAIGDVVTQAGLRYICRSPHTSGTFATDLAASDWVSLDAATGGTAAQKSNPGYDVILLLGQSNMSGRGTSYDTTRYDVSDPRILQYGASGTYASVISSAVEPLAMHDTPSGIGPGLHFARWYLTQIDVGRRVLLVPAAHGGTQLSTNTTPLGWRYGVSGNLAALAITQARNALVAAGPGSQLAAALWVQGESDGDGSVSGSTYQTDLDALIDGLRTGLGVPTLPFVIGQMVPDYLTTGTRNAINTVHAATPGRKSSTAFAYGLPLANLGDGNHYNAVAQRYLGRSLYDAYRALTTGTALTVPAQVTGLAVTPSTTSAAASWTAAAAALSYLVEYRTSPSGTWTKVVAVTALSGTVTGLTQGTAYDFRVSALNAAGPGTVSSTVTATTTGTATLLDGVGASAARAYSTRKLRTAYAGSAIRVRRSSDSTEQDIGFTSGNLDTTSLLAFAGSGSAYVKTWYDQSGNASDLTQATTAAQARIVNAGTLDAVTSIAAPVFDGAATYYTDSTPTLYAAGAASLACVIKPTSAGNCRVVSEASTTTTNPQYVLLAQSASTTNPFEFVRDDAAGVIYNGDTGGGSIPAVFNSALHQVSVVDTGSASSIYTDGTQNGTTASYTRSGTLTPDNFTIGALRRTTVGSYYNGNLSEVVVWASALSGSDRTTVQANQKAYFGTP